jgi:hypothetical protein
MCTNIDRKIIEMVRSYIELAARQVQLDLLAILHFQSYYNFFQAPKATMKYDTRVRSKDRFEQH